MFDNVKGVLYEEDGLKVTYLYSPELGKEDEIVSVEDHELWIKEGEEWRRYIIQRGVLRELSDTFKRNPLGLMDKLDTLNREIFHGACRAGIGVSEIGHALESAYQTEQDVFEAYLAEQRTDE